MKINGQLKKKNTSKITIAIYPNERGMGYVVCEHPNDILNYGIGKFKLLSPNNYVKRLLKFIKHYRPEIVILKGYHDSSNAIGNRVKKVVDRLQLEAIKHDVEVFKYPRSEVAKVFAHYGDTNKYEISRTLAGWFPFLKQFLSPLRTFTMSEDYHMGIFDAFALMYTHNVLTGNSTKQNEN